MLANFEKREYQGKERVWTGRYRNLHNLPHWHLESELIFIEQGNTTVSHNHQEYDLQAGDAIFLSSGEIHYIKSEEDSIVSICLFDSALIQDLLRHQHLTCAKLQYSYPISDCFEKIKEELIEQKPFFELQICTQITTLMIEIFRTEDTTNLEHTKEQSSIAKYKNLLATIEEKYNYITFSEAAALMGLSEPYFSKFFRKISGMTFSQYLNMVRLEKAIDLLHHNEQQRSITEIATDCGFDTIRHFNRTFKNITGMTPRQLPKDYTLDVQPLRTIKDAFDPTLQTSELL